MKTENIKTLALTLALTLIVIYIVTPHEWCLMLGLKSDSPMIARLTYQLVHDNPIHLSLNVFSLLSLVFLAEARLSHIVAAVLIAATLPTALTADIPILGISVTNFALTGILITYSKRIWTLIAINLLFVALTALVSNVATLPHLYGLSCGVLYGIIFTPRYDE